MNSFLPKNFLNHYWDQRPLLIKNAFPHIAQLADPKDFIEMAGDDLFESKLLLMAKKLSAWTIKQGPFKSRDLNKNKKFTLYVHSLNCFFSEIYQLEKKFAILPSWMFDDIMGCFSQKGSSSGAHKDRYGVFIIQAQGQRRWDLDDGKNNQWVDNTDVKLLANFKIKKSLVLNPGDLLYIPPDLGHRAISLKDSISYSVGFRAFDQETLINDFLAYKLENAHASEKINKPFLLKLKVQKNEKKLNPKNILRIKKNLFFSLTQESSFNEWLGVYLTKPRIDFEPPAKIVDLQSLTTALKRQRVYRHPYLKSLAFGQRFFIGGKEFSKIDYSLVKEMVSSDPTKPILFKKSQRFINVLRQLYGEGMIIFA